MPHEYATRIPVDDQYLISLGRATYIFAYYESMIVDLVDRFTPGFKTDVARSKSNYTAGRIRGKLKELIDSASTDFSRISKGEMQAVHDRFDAFIDRRNSLIHGRPITAHDGSQILAYQGHEGKANPDEQWPAPAIDDFSDEVAKERIENLGPLFERVR